MPLGLVTLPLRLGLRVAGIVLRPVASALGLAGHDADTRVEAVREEPRRPDAPPRRRPVRVPPPARRRPESRADVPEEPEHVSEEPVVVAEVADQGAEESPGPQISVDEPWEGYRRMKAADVIDRLAVASPEEIAVVQLYESTHKRRKTVLEAAAHSQRK
jgi:hypothetical protein